MIELNESITVGNLTARVVAISQGVVLVDRRCFRCDENLTLVDFSDGKKYCLSCCDMGIEIETNFKNLLGENKVSTMLDDYFTNEGYKLVVRDGQLYKLDIEYGMDGSLIDIADEIDFLCGLLTERVNNSLYSIDRVFSNDEVKKMFEDIIVLENVLR